MKSSIKIATILLLTITLFFGSCGEDWLELENPNRVDEFNIQSPSGIRQLEIGMYRRLADLYNYFWQLYMSHLPLEYAMYVTIGEGPYHLQIMDLNIAPTNPFILWLYADYYSMLTIANRIIEALENDMGTVNRLSEREFDLILGSAYYMRAFSHFYLLHSWGRPFDSDDNEWGVIMHTSVVSEREQAQKSRSRTSEVYDQIEKDLLAAEDILILSSELLPSELGRPTRGAATALLGKTYLFRKKYQDAANKFKQFIDENPDKYLLPYYGDNFHGKYENGPESVFEVQFADLVTTNRWQGGGTGNHYQIYAGGHGMGRNNFQVPLELMKREDDSDAVPGALSNFDIRDIRFSETVYSAGPTRTYVFLGDTIEIRDSLFFTNPPRRITRTPRHRHTPKKYISNRRTASNAGGLATDISYENQNVMRVAEVYLLYAEALANLNEFAEANIWLNKVVRRARGYRLDETTPYDFNGSNLADFMEFLIEEKRKEFIGEQIRWYDVLRWGVVEDELLRLKDHPQPRPQWNDKSTCFPIPRAEMNANPLLKQNPGY
jgi:starch-binding outer membrane protein, SusD/RagB family